MGNDCQREAASARLGGPGAALARLTFACLVLSAVPIVSPRPAVAQAISAQQQLAEQFAPIAYLRTQTRACDRNGEGYVPSPVEVVLGNPAVVLKERVDGSTSARDPVVTTAPTAQDLAGRGEDFYLDFPGNPRRVACTYERGFKRVAAENNVQPTTYARIVVDTSEQRLILQYWFWYYFNDWNNTHESDWEMIQLVFAATSAEAALTRTPEVVGYAQHGGGEIADWDDEKLARDGSHPLVFPAAGSHGTYYDQRHYIGWGANGTGFGCDNTSTPSRRTPLAVVLIPDEITADGPFAWLLFEGRWGERQEWEFNGPFGPNAGDKWDDPLDAMETWRETSLYIPASRSLGPTATSTFCSWTSAGSQLFILFGTRPELLLVMAVGVLAVVGLLFATRRREIGAALALYRRHFRTFLLIGLLTIPIGILFNAVTLIASEYPPMEWLVHWFNDTAGARFIAAMSIGGLQQVSMILVVAPPVIQAIKEISAGRSPRAIDCIHEGYRHLTPLAVGLILVYATIGVLLLLLIGVPLAIWLSVRWQFFGQATILEDTGHGRAAIRKSAAVTRGHWWRTLTHTLVFQVIAVLPGPLVGLPLMLLGKTTVQLANSLSSLVFAVTVPISVIGLTLAYERFREYHAAEEAAVWETPQLVP